MQVLKRSSEGRVLVSIDLMHDLEYDITLKNKFSCENVELKGVGFVCKNKAYLLITTDVPCGKYDLIINNYQLPVQIK